MEWVDGRRPRRKCATKITPSSSHYIGYVEEGETIEAIMKKFETLDEIMKKKTENEPKEKVKEEKEPEKEEEKKRTNAD